MFLSPGLLLLVCRYNRHGTGITWTRGRITAAFCGKKLETKNETRKMKKILSGQKLMFSEKFPNSAKSCRYLSSSYDVETETGVWMKAEKRKQKIKAVMTVEASLVLPVFMILFMNLLSVIEVYRIHSSVAVSLWERGREDAEALYLKELAKEDAGEKKGGIVIQRHAYENPLSVQYRIVKDLEEYPIWERIVSGGKGGFLVVGKSGKDGIIQIDCSYKIKPLFSAFTPVSKRLANRYYGHGWIGYIHEGEGEAQKETYVYITETGTVYHRNRGCSYLNPSIQSTSANEVGNLRNKNGAVYYACPLCDEGSAAGKYYVTDYGTNYHTGITCSGLKRTIYEVKLSEVGGRSACSKCGG